MAGDTADTTTVAYSGVFDPVWYMDTYYNSVTFESDEDKLLQFYIEKYHDIKQSGGVTGGSLLDVGTGPSIHSIISACRHVDDVYLSDFTPQNRRVLADWWKSDKLSIENVTEYILKLENSRQTAAERQEMMKEKVRDILPIDITLPKPIGSGCDVTQFDVITSSLCLESAAQTLDQYRSNAGNVSSLLKSGDI